MDKDLPDAKVDVVLGGFPCQSFSYAGKRKGLSDPRGQLYLQMIRVLDHFQPKMFVAENVDGIRNSRKNICGQNVDKTALDTILEDFDKHGYDVQYHMLLAADYGVPQMRRRVIIMGINRKYGNLSNEYYPAPLYNEEGTDGKRKWLTAKDGIDDLWDKVNKTFIPNHTSRDISKAKFYPGKKMQGNNRILVMYYLTSHQALEFILGWLTINQMTSPEKISVQMKKIHSKDTKPELKLCKSL